MSKKANHIFPDIDFDKTNYRGKLNDIISESALQLAKVHCVIDPEQREEFLESIVEYIKFISLEIETNLENSIFLA